MPHLFLDYSPNMSGDIDPKAMLLDIHEILAGNGIFRLEDFKTRITVSTDCVIGNGKRDQAFIMLEIRTFDGKDRKQKNAILELALETMKRHCAGAMATRHTDISALVSEIDRNSYVRARSGNQRATP